MECKHTNRAGDNYGESCTACGKVIKGYGYGGWFGINLAPPKECIHQWLPVGDPPTEYVCPYCEGWKDSQ